uniref:Uncharacterized protein n=1 Tax=Phaeomonas parva TaxID=124430 RepID=A0A7S1UDM3_9STRA
MGIPKLFRWLTDQYPSVTQGVSDSLGPDRQVDNLYLDMNGIIHPMTHGNSDSFVALDEEAMFRRIFAYTDKIYKLVKPTRLFFLAVDGVAPRAKVNQQRSRRFRSAKEAEQMMAGLVAQGEEIPENVERFDSNCITPGTEFMYRLGMAFRKWIQFKMDTDPAWAEAGCRVVFSGPDVPGEGEHKVMDYIRTARGREKDWRAGMTHCLYGLDADLIMLGLVTHEPNFILFRERMQRRGRGRNGNGGQRDPLRFTHDDYEILEVTMIRKMLHLEMRKLVQSGDLPFEYSLQRVVDDFVFLCMLVGNDFLPHVPHLDIADGAINMMMATYKRLLPKMGGYLTDKGAIHFGRFELFMADVSRREPLYFHRRGVAEKDVQYQSPEYPETYYREKLQATTPEDRRKVLRDYLGGLLWNLAYYHDGCSSWTWYLPHHYAPLATDFKDLATIAPEIPQGKPLTPLMQLLAVLPRQSAKLLPGPYKELACEDASPLSHYFPNDFEMDPNGKKNAWEAVALLPFINEAEYLETLSTLDHDGMLNNDEKKRNEMGKVHVFLPAVAGAKE